MEYFNGFGLLMLACKTQSLKGNSEDRSSSVGLILKITLEKLERDRTTWIVALV